MRFHLEARICHPGPQGRRLRVTGQKGRMIIRPYCSLPGFRLDQSGGFSSLRGSFLVTYSSCGSSHSLQSLAGTRESQGKKKMARVLSCVLRRKTEKSGTPSGSPPCCRFGQEGGARRGFLFATFEVRPDTKAIRKRRPQDGPPVQYASLSYRN